MTICDLDIAESMMIDIKNKHECTGCTACTNICGHQAIIMRFDEYGHSYPVVDRDRCINCGLCEAVCPLLHLNRIPENDNWNELRIKAVYNKKEHVRSESTSGGVFPVLSEYVLERGGLVYAARFDASFHIEHASFKSMDDIRAFCGSKYAQSELGDTFRRIKNNLKDKKVLFVGTPCQVAGLKAFLRKDHESLLTCDFICMGISSPVVWDEYLRQYWDIETIRRIVFKDKRKGWHQWRMLIEDDRGEHLCDGKEDPFFYSYLTHLTYRPSCFRCPFRSLHRMSDFTIGDCWGIDKFNLDFDDNRGCSTLILQNERAEKVFERIKEKLNTIDYPWQAVTRYNPYSINLIPDNPYRERFYAYWKEKGLRPALDKALDDTRQSVFKKIVRKLLNHVK